MTPSQPKARFYKRLNENDYLNLTIWAGKTDPSSEIIVMQFRRKDEEKWETCGRLAVYRSAEGKYTELPERQE